MRVLRTFPSVSDVSAADARVSTPSLGLFAPRTSRRARASFVMSSAFASAVRRAFHRSDVTIASSVALRAFASSVFERMALAPSLARSAAVSTSRRAHASSTASTANAGERASESRTTPTSSTSEPGMSPLRRAPPPARATRGAVIPGALTDGGISERARAVLRDAKGSPKKFSAFLRLIRGLRVDDALIQCDMSPKRVAKTVGKVIQSAVGNAVNNQGLDRDRLVIAWATVGKGQYLRRVSMHGRGRAGVMHRPRTHVAIAVEENDDVERSVQIFDDEMPWQRRRRLGRAKQAIAEAAGIA